MVKTLLAPRASEASVHTGAANQPPHALPSALSNWVPAGSISVTTMLLSGKEPTFVSVMRYFSAPAVVDGEMMAEGPSFVMVRSGQPTLLNARALLLPGVVSPGAAT